MTKQHILKVDINFDGAADETRVYGPMSSDDAEKAWEKVDNAFCSDDEENYGIAGYEIIELEPIENLDKALEPLK